MKSVNESRPALTLVKSLQEFNKFIKGGEYGVLSQSMRIYNRHFVKFNRDFYLLKIHAGKDYESDLSPQKSGREDNNNLAIIEELETLLTNLSIPKYRWGRYLNSQLTVHKLLCQLNADLQIKANIQVNTIIELLDKRKNHNKKAYLIATAISFLFLAGAIVSPFLLAIIELAKVVLSTAMVFPIFGLVSTIATATFFAYQNHFDQKRSLFNRLRDNSFLLFKTALNLSGNIVWIASATLVAPIASVAIMLVASLMDVAKEVFATVQNYLLYKEYETRKKPLHLTPNLHAQQEHARHRIGYLQHKNAAIINTVTAIALFATMLAWQLVPGGIFVAAGAMAVMGLIYLGQYLMLKTNKRIMRDQLQDKLRHLEQEYELQMAGKGSELMLEDTLENDAIRVSSVKRPRELGDSLELQAEAKRPRREMSVSSFNYAEKSELSFFGHQAKETRLEPVVLAEASVEMSVRH